MADAPSWVTLTEGEQVVWSGRPSNVRVAEELLLETVLVAVGLALFLAPVDEYVPVDVPDLGVYPLALVAIGALLAAVTWIRFKLTAYVLTTKELYKKEGLVSRSVQTMRLDRVQDHGFEQSALQRIFGYGDVYVSTAGSSGSNFAFENAPNPDEVAAHISEQLEAVRGRQPAGQQVAPEPE